MAEFRLTEAQAAVVAHEGGALLISAGAGSGKTRVLVERLLARLARGIPLDSFLIITYTRAAAAELRGRILQALRDRLRTDPDPRLREQIMLVPHASIGTIHSFCSGLLRENARLLGIRPDFRLGEETETEALMREILQELLARRYEEQESGFTALANAVSSGESDRELEKLVLKTYRDVQSHPDPERWLRAQMETPAPAGDAGETAWGKLLLSQALRRIAFWQRSLTAALDSLEAVPRAQAAYGPAIRADLDQLAEVERALRRGWEAAVGLEKPKFARMGSYKGIGEAPEAARAKKCRDSCKEGLRKLMSETLSVDSGVLLEDVAATIPVAGALLALVRDLSEAYAAEKRRQGLMDYSDLEHLALRLLTEEDRKTPSALAKELSARYTEILVDEYQDCSQVQENIFFALSREGKNVTMVGDVKQSIYRFRLADPELFRQKYRSYRDAPGAAPGRRILLPENFRSDKGILRPVNEFFTAVMSEELGDLDYGPTEALKPGPEARDTEGAFRLFVTEGDIRAEAEAAAGYVAWLLQSGMTVPEKSGDRPLRPDDVALLLRSNQGKDRIYAEALQRRGIPAVCPKSRSGPEDRPEVRWAVSLLAVIDNPRQDVPLLTALRSPVFRFTEERLAEIRVRDRNGAFIDALAAAAGTEADCREALEVLARWRERATLVSAEELICELCAETGLRALAEAAEPGAAANLDALTEAARSYAGTGREDLHSFVRWLREAGEQGNPVVSVTRGGSGVKITTIHSAKGLEWPVVLLADLMHQFNMSDASKHLLVHPKLGVGLRRIDRTAGVAYETLSRQAIAAQINAETLSEELRVLYVAMTRARQHLALFCRVRSLDDAREKSRPAEGPLDPMALAGKKSPGDWILTASLALGGAGDWAWRTPPAAERWTPPAAEAAPAEALDPALVRARLDWKYARPADVRLPSKLTATAVRDTFPAAEAAEGADELPAQRRRASDLPPWRPGAAAELTPAERGSAVHLAMQYADLELCAAPEGAARALEELRKKRILTEAQFAAVQPEKLSAFCAGPLMALLKQGELHREFKFSLLVPVKEFLGEGDGETLLQGVVDLWSETPEGVVLVDFKTDRVNEETLAARAEEYAPQLEVYARALERITGKPVLRRFLWFFAVNGSVELPPRPQGREHDE